VRKPLHHKVDRPSRRGELVSRRQGPPRRRGPAGTRSRGRVPRVGSQMVPRVDRRLLHLNGPAGCREGRSPKMRLPRIPKLRDTEPELCQLNSPRSMNDPGLHIPDTKQTHNVRNESRDVARKCAHHKQGKTFLIQMIGQATWIRNSMKVESDAWLPPACKLYSTTTIVY